MRNPFTSFDWRLEICRRGWIVAVALTLILRLTAFLHSPQQERFNLFLAFALGTWLPVMFLNALEGYRLRSYFSAHHGSPRDFLPGVRFLRWFFSRDSYGDPQLEVLRQEMNRWRRFVLMVFFTYPVMFFVCAV